MRLPIQGTLRWLHPNADQSGYYRWSVAPSMLSSLLDAAPSGLSERERVGLASNCWSLVEAGTLPGHDFLAAMARLAAHEDELRIALGGLSACPVSPADVYRALVREAAAAVVFAHNHPSGEPTPSQDDIALTARLARAGALLGIRVLDHIIVGHEGYFSFLDAGLLPITVVEREVA